MSQTKSGRTVKAPLSVLIETRVHSKMNLLDKLKDCDGTQPDVKITLKEMWRQFNVDHDAVIGSISKCGAAYETKFYDDDFIQTEELITEAFQKFDININGASSSVFSESTRVSTKSKASELITTMNKTRRERN